MQRISELCFLTPVQTWLHLYPTELILLSKVNYLKISSWIMPGFYCHIIIMTVLKLHLKLIDLTFQILFPSFKSRWSMPAGFPEHNCRPRSRMWPPHLCHITNMFSSCGRVSHSTLLFLVLFINCIFKRHFEARAILFNSIDWTLLGLYILFKE